MRPTRTTRGLIGGAGQRIVRGTKRLPAKAKKAPIVARKGIGKPASSASTGIRSPLTEVANTRWYYATPHEITSSDGLLVLQYVNLAGITLVDAVGRSIAFVYADYEPA